MFWENLEIVLFFEKKPYLPRLGTVLAGGERARN
jgi:hypothetical protein